MVSNRMRFTKRLKRKFTNSFKWIEGFLIVFLMGAMGCGDNVFESIGDSETSPLSKGQFDPTRFAFIGEVSNCLHISDGWTNACIFRKNPIADQGGRLPSPPPLVNAGSVLEGETNELIGITDVSHLQTTAVYLPGSQLGNMDFVIDYSEVFDPAPLIEPNSDGNWKYSFYNEEHFNALNVHIFFWANYLKQRVKDITGHFYPEGQGLILVPIFPFYKKKVLINALWIYDLNALVFGLSPSVGVDSIGKSTHVPLGFDSGIVAHEIGHAILDYASVAKIQFNKSLEMRDCGRRRKAVCSKDFHGSPRAIHEGVGDVLALFLFPESTPFGELLEYSPEGLDHCGVSRNVQEIKNQKITARHLFEACGGRVEAPGEIHAMGSIYSTIWYGLFERAFQRGGKNERDRAYHLFFEHLKNVTSNDTFLTMKKTIQIIDQNLFDGQFSEDLDREYSLMGYP